MPISGNQTTGSSFGEVQTYDPSSNQIFDILTNGRLCVANAQFPIFNPNTYVANFNGSININGSYYSYDTSAVQLPADTSANRPTLTGANYKGIIRYNTTSISTEFYDGSGWYPMAPSPVIATVSPSYVLNSSPTNSPITITGINFNSGTTVTFFDISGTQYTPSSITFTNNTQLIAYTPAIALQQPYSPYTIKVVNPNGIHYSLANAYSIYITPVFVTPAGSIGNIYYLSSSNYTLLPVTANGGGTITYSISSGSLPGGLSLNSTTGAITGTATQLVTTTTYTFTILASTAYTSASRIFSITVYQQQTVVYKTPGSTVFSIPTNVNNIQAKLWGAGGGAYGDLSQYCGYGGAGGFSTSTFNVLTASGESALTIYVGKGGIAQPAGGDGGGGSGANGGAGGGGLSAIFSGSVATPLFSPSATTYVSSIAQPSITSLSGATGVILVAGGGGGAGWDVNGLVSNGANNQPGGNGGGINGNSGVGNSNYGGNGNAGGGGTQSAGGSNQGGTSTSGGYLQGGYVLSNPSSGGSGGGGGGFYGGGCYQGTSGGIQNSGGGGGSGFVGFANGSLSTVLTAVSGNNYSDTTTRTNGGRTYTNSTCNATASPAVNPPLISDSDYTTNAVAATSGTTNTAASGYGALYTTSGNTAPWSNNGGPGLVVLKY